jgi:hypothetical protein
MLTSKSSQILHLCHPIIHQYIVSILKVFLYNLLLLHGLKVDFSIPIIMRKPIILCHLLIYKINLHVLFMDAVLSTKSYFLNYESSELGNFNWNALILVFFITKFSMSTFPTRIEAAYI